MQGDYVFRLFTNAIGQGKEPVMFIRFEAVGIEAQVRFRRYR